MSQTVFWCLYRTYTDWQQFKHPAHNRFECLAHINDYNNILQNISDIYVRRSKKKLRTKEKKQKQGGEYKLKHAPGCWNLQQLKPSVLFLNCVTGWWRIAGAAAVKPVTGWFIVLRYGRVSLLPTRSLTVCFVGLDLFCCTSDGLLFFFFFLLSAVPVQGDSRLRWRKDMNL